MNSPLQISDRVRTLAGQADRELGGQFARIDAIAQANSQPGLAVGQGRSLIHIDQPTRQEAI